MAGEAESASPCRQPEDSGRFILSATLIHRPERCRALLVIEVGSGRALSSLIDGIDPGYLCLPIEPKPLRTRSSEPAGRRGNGSLRRRDLIAGER